MQKEIVNCPGCGRTLGADEYSRRRTKNKKLLTVNLVIITNCESCRPYKVKFKVNGAVLELIGKAKPVNGVRKLQAA